MGEPRSDFNEWVRKSDEGQRAQPPDADVSARSRRGGCCRCGPSCHDFSATAPRIDPKELFVNVTVHDIEEDIPVKGIQSWLGGVMGQVMGGGKYHYHTKISENHFKENVVGIKTEVLKAFLLRGWQCEVSTMQLPPHRGKEQASCYLQLTRDALPIFMVLRVQLQGRYWQFSNAFDCSHMSCCRPFDRKESEAIGLELQDALQHQRYMRQLRRPIVADVKVMDAADEMHVLYNMHWSEEQAAVCILQSRKLASASAESADDLLRKNTSAANAMDGTGYSARSQRSEHSLRSPQANNAPRSPQAEYGARSPQSEYAAGSPLSEYGGRSYSLDNARNPSFGRENLGRESFGRESYSTNLSGRHPSLGL